MGFPNSITGATGSGKNTVSHATFIDPKSPVFLLTGDISQKHINNRQNIDFFQLQQFLGEASGSGSGDSTKVHHSFPRLPHFPIPLPTRTTMPSPKDANYMLDIMPEDRLFTDAHPDDLIIVSVMPLLLHPIFLIFFKRYGHDRGRKEHRAAAF
jgi:hypothetical protein